MPSKPAVILVVDDEPLIRFSAIDVLESEGYEAIEAANADEALVFINRRDDIDVVFTDVNMPGSLDGIQLAQRARAIRPKMGIIITSGMVRLLEPSLPPETVFFPKPYQFDKLLGSIRKMLKT
jgi:DNA-binding NtrC family response regulator